MAGDAFLGAIFMFGGNFAPLGYAFCNGTLMSIAQNSALFQLLGTTYGGDGVQTFALPDLRGRIPVHAGPGFVWGQTSGEEAVQLTVNQMAIHSHTVNAVSGMGNQTSPVGHLWAAGTVPRYAAPGTAASLNAAAVGTGGGSQPHDNMSPFLSITFIIALEGIYPSQN
jgi:microcystin-dependent protein